MAAVRNKHRGTIDQADAASPTTLLESVLLNSTNDSEEGRDVEMIYIPNTLN